MGKQAKWYIKLRFRHFEAQNGLCWWCGKLMKPQAESHHDPDLLTLDHLYSKLDSRREMDKSSVAACYDCNQKRNLAEVYLLRERNRERSLRNKLPVPPPNARLLEK